MKISNQDLENVFHNTSFGTTNYLELVHKGLSTVAGGFATGHTISCILTELGLQRKEHPRGKQILTKKGESYMAENSLKPLALGGSNNTTPELIDDPRLTPTMKRVRSGRTQLFREPNQDNVLTCKKTCDVSLEHENKSVYAELIDGQWYWVNGCPECHGKPRDWMTYQECENHDRCVECKIKNIDLSSDITRWGGSPGWTCGPCKKKNMPRIRISAFEKFNSEDHPSYHWLCMDEPECPHCGSLLDCSDVQSNDQIECGVCSGGISLEVHHQQTYSVSIYGARVTE